MRLPWPFGRRTPSDGPPSATPEDARDGAVDAGAVLVRSGLRCRGRRRVSHLAPATGAWATLPPIQRTAGDPPLVAPAAPFLAGVPGHRPLPPIVRPLGHEAGPVGAAGPRGRARLHRSEPDLARTHARAPGPATRNRAGVPRPDDVRGWSRGTRGDRPGDTLEYPRRGHRPAAALPGPAAAPGTPIRKLAAVGPAATVTPAARPLTLGPEPVAATRRSTGTAGAPSAAATSSARPAGVVRRAGCVPDTAPGAPRRPRAAPDRLARSAAGPRPRPPAPGRPRSGWAQPAPPPRIPSGGADQARLKHVPSPASRRAGLGAPLAVPPASAVAQRLPAGGLPLRPGAAAAQPPAGPAAQPPPRAGPPPSSRGRRPCDGRDRDRCRSCPSPAAAPDGRARDTRPAPFAPAGACTARPHHPGRLSRPASASPMRPRPAVAPAPRRPRLRRRRRVRGPGSADPPDDGLAPPPHRRHHPARARDRPAAPRRAPRSPPAGRPATTCRRRSAASAPLPGRELRADAVPLQRLADVPAAAGPTARRRPAAEIVFPPRDASGGPGPGDRRPGATGDVGRRPAIADVQRQAAPGVSAPAPRRSSRHRPRSRAPRPGSVRSRARAGTLDARTDPRPPRATGAAAPPAAAPVVCAHRRRPGVAGHAAPRPGVRRRVGRHDPSAASRPRPSSSASTAPPLRRPSAEGRSETELDQLARDLFGRIRTHLRAEVIHEREARGLTFDAF